MHIFWRFIRAWVSIYAYYEIYLNSKGNNYNYSNLTTRQLYQKCLDAMEQMEVVRSFEAYIANIDLSTVNNGVIEQAQAEYKKIPANLTDKISKEAMEKYRAILALDDPVKPLIPSQNQFEGEIASSQTPPRSTPQNSPVHARQSNTRF